MRFTTVFILAVAAAAPALASYSDFDARDNAWTSLEARGGKQSKQQAPPQRDPATMWKSRSSYATFRANRPNPPTNYRRWLEELEARGDEQSQPERLKGSERLRGGRRPRSFELEARGAGQSKVQAAEVAKAKEERERNAWKTHSSYDWLKTQHPDWEPRDHGMERGSRRTAPQQRAVQRAQQLAQQHKQ
ncbi:hypothetical protein C8Q72DRAFT_822058 [Fomitopsis betulina]|nr:hypothetical protein C8Q72DRAFT_822058 [Fomitopsis betulina]